MSAHGKLASRSVCSLMCLWLAGLGSAAALDYPSRPIMMIVPYPPGGQGDTIGRIVAERMRTTLGQPVIIENVGGASGSIGVGRVARAAPDGYMLVLGSFSNMVVSGAVFDLKYDLLKDFEPVALLPTQPFVIVARKTMPATNLKELIAWLKANPDKASQGTSGFGAASHLAGVLFQKETGTRYPFVNYRGTAMQDLVAGHIDLMIDNASTALPQVRAGTIKAYAVASKHRLAAASDIPTVDEAGLPGYYMSLWNGFWVPKGTPEPIIAKLNAATVDALSDPVAQHQLGQFGLQLYSREQETPEALGALQRAEIAKWWPIIKAAGIKVE